MSKNDPRTQIVATMRANLGLINGDLTGFLTRECDDLLAAGVEPAALSFSLLQLALFHSSQNFGTAETINQLRNVADVMEKRLADKRAAFDERVQH